MNNIVTLIRQDFRQATRSVIPVIVLVGVILIPSFFAWFNVLSSWKPFDNVSNLKIAVASADEGFESSLFPMRLNVGEQVVSQLRANSDIDWQFVSKSEAIDGTKSEKYYAAIVLPPDFSKKMLTFLSPGASPVDIDLYVNEKKNALSSLITGEAATEVSTQINTSFTQTLDEVGLALVSSLATHLEDSDAQETLDRLKSAVGRISVQLNSAAGTAGMFAGLLSSADSLLSSAGSLSSSASQAVQDTTGAIGQGVESVGSVQGVLTSASELLSKVFTANADSYDALRAEINRTFGQAPAAQQAGDGLAQASGMVDGQVAAYTQLRDQLRAQESTPGLDPVARGAVGLLADSVDAVIDRQVALRRGLDAASSPASQGIVDREATRKAILQDVDGAQSALTAARDQYTNSLQPQLARLAADLQAVQGSFAGIGRDLRAADQSLAAGAGSLSASLSDGETAARLLASGLGKSADAFAQLDEALQQASKSGDLSEVSRIIGSSPAKFAAELASPVSLDTIPVFKVDNFGSQMAPLYSVLGLWVGALLLSVLIRAEVSRDALPPLKRPLRPWQEYFGHYVIFGGLAFVQSTLLFVGLIGFVGVRPVHPLLLILAGWVMAFVFSLITYTLVLAFGEAGKAIAVLLLVVQISAGGGAYPLDVLPQWFQNISPFVPVSHATSAVRSAIAGIYQGDYWKDLGWLLLFIVPTLFIGLVLRLAVRKFNDDLNKSLEGTKLMSV
ncbi:YhgE/Pip domain-containing protein [Tomitella fengzijianii]|uniref:YhgE/Pip domain-containing protein n=1 Tax=Tomitella fengzijianii TaxID=2597660 RepID=A0A516WZP8_9ACTN|nr:YhgE/Pip domain-containing protein [Tomitella fengzijianii]QDQ96285.1 YhgE/Pip domain-containing protein [Tomitella fengzijianii]